MFKDPVDHTSRFLSAYERKLMEKLAEEGRDVSLIGVEFLDTRFIAVGEEEETDGEEGEKKKKQVLRVFTNTFGEYNSGEEIREVRDIKDNTFTLEGAKGDIRFSITILQDTEGKKSVKISTSTLPDLDSN